MFDKKGHETCTPTHGSPFIARNTISEEPPASRLARRRARGASYRLSGFGSLAAKATQA